MRCSTVRKVKAITGKRLLKLLQKDALMVRNSVRKFLTDAKQDGKLVHGYGASTKGNTLLQHFGITAELLPAIADRNHTKFGCRTPGTNIPIISEDVSRQRNPDYYFVLPWHFREGFIAREQAFPCTRWQVRIPSSEI